MNQPTLPLWTAAPGDILLLSGKSKNRPLNLGYQSIARVGQALYTHVALVISPYRVMHAVPGEGVEIRAWREIRETYDLGKSSVARLRELDEDLRVKLLARANYYFGLRYSVLALAEKPETFSHQESIVCSQFVARVLHDVGVKCTSGRVRKCLPADIHNHTAGSLNWLRHGLVDYMFDPAIAVDSDVSSVYAELNFELDGYCAKALKTSFMVSRARYAMETAMASMIEFVEGGLITVEDLPASLGLTNHVISPDDWEAAWTQEFAVPHLPAVFLHESGPQRDQARLRFIRSCEKLGEIAQAAFDQIALIGEFLEDWATLQARGISQNSPVDAHHYLVEPNARLLEMISMMDRVLGWQENSEEDFSMDLRGRLATGIFTCEEDISLASQCLLKISDFARAKSSWNRLRPAVHAQTEQVSSILAEDVEGRIPFDLIRG
ncbi:hypothetical protein HX799_10855 [Pseudomonas tolaasii]|uniref:hypothetical protein n=1 Tax=Pseudomonas tolaasii TaxID=29442 RepID=UPI0015A1FB99|nr:hypothetical protein [Pseudomonas tolaasii]MBW1250033.1 hypothetical protein [Pseudomonas tolaasii]NWC28466.1 hypothetical protein [Pseudomonas tolaasii]NWC51658.1 hypothetical protein [Pseudomonas tolaasii]NWE65275.1 hypothetical protein [Pseudomonas tolaasii]